MKSILLFACFLLPATVDAAFRGGGPSRALSGGLIEKDNELFASSVKLQAIMLMIQIENDVAVNPAPDPAPAPEPDIDPSKPAIGHNRRCQCRGTGLISTPDGVGRMTCPGRRSNDVGIAGDDGVEMAQAIFPASLDIEYPSVVPALPRGVCLDGDDSCLAVASAVPAPATFAAAAAPVGRQVVIATKEPCDYCAPAHEVEAKLRTMGFKVGPDTNSQVRLLDLARNGADFSKYQITHTPTILVLDNDKVRGRLVGSIACKLTDEALGKLFESQPVASKTLATPVMASAMQPPPTREPTPAPVRGQFIMAPKTYAPMPTHYSSRRIRRGHR